MKNAVVTGAAGGMGRAIVARLLEEGFQVAGVDLDETGLQGMADKHGAAFLPMSADLTDAAAVAGVFETLAVRVGGVDALVNNAGTCFMSDFPNIPTAELHRQMDVNFYSAFHCCQAAVPQMLRREGGQEDRQHLLERRLQLRGVRSRHYRA